MPSPKKKKKELSSSSLSPLPPCQPLMATKEPNGQQNRRKARTLQTKVRSHDCAPLPLLLCSSFSLFLFLSNGAPQSSIPPLHHDRIAKPMTKVRTKKLDRDFRSSYLAIRSGSRSPPQQMVVVNKSRRMGGHCQ